jgi:hypothetical protein
MWWFHAIYSIIAFVLFLLLSPGMLLTIPPVTASKVFRTGQTSLWAAMVHAVVYVVVLQLVNWGVTAAIAATHSTPKAVAVLKTITKPTATTAKAAAAHTAATAAAPSAHPPLTKVAVAAATVAEAVNDNPVTPHLAVPVNVAVAFPCDHNCGRYSDTDCLRCINCGMCSTTKTDKETGEMTTTKRCLPGNEHGSLFEKACKGTKWQYMTNTTTM